MVRVSGMTSNIALELLHAWAVNAERHWYPIPGRPAQGCYGTGYNAWGVQTNQKYMAALATLALRGEGLAGLDRHGRATGRWPPCASASPLTSAATARAPTARSGATPGSSALGIERMMHGVYLLWPELTEADRDGVRRMLVSECEWIMAGFHRGQVGGVVADVWNSSGKNAPESNLWNGAILWRTAAMVPIIPTRPSGRSARTLFLVNSVSVAADADGRDDDGGQAGASSGTSARTSFRTMRSIITAISTSATWSSVSRMRPCCTSTASWPGCPVRRRSIITRPTCGDLVRRLDLQRWPAGAHRGG